MKSDVPGRAETLVVLPARARTGGNDVVVLVVAVTPSRQKNSLYVYTDADGRAHLVHHAPSKVTRTEPVDHMDQSVVRTSARGSSRCRLWQEVDHTDYDARHARARGRAVRPIPKTPTPPPSSSSSSSSVARNRKQSWAPRARRMRSHAPCGGAGSYAVVRDECCSASAVVRCAATGDAVVHAGDAGVLANVVVAVDGRRRTLGHVRSLRCVFSLHDANAASAVTVLYERVRCDLS